jgi:pimeloyl-ACP methyl ester carboxylesterase
VRKIVRHREIAWPVPPVRREVITSRPVLDSERPPVLFVPGFGAGAWVYAEHWLDHAAERGFRAQAMSLRGHGESGSAPRTTLRAYAHDVVQVAASLPRQAVLVGHGAGALVVTRALATGTPLSLLDRPDPDLVTGAAKDGCTLVSLVPTLLGRIDPALFRVVVLGGSAMPSALPPNAVPTYGLTETGGGVVYDGRPLDGVEVDLRPVPGLRDHEGEIRIRAPMVARR